MRRFLEQAGIDRHDRARDWRDELERPAVAVAPGGGSPLAYRSADPRQIQAEDIAEFALAEIRQADGDQLAFRARPQVLLGEAQPARRPGSDRRFLSGPAFAEGHGDDATLARLAVDFDFDVGADSRVLRADVTEAQIAAGDLRRQRAARDLAHLLAAAKDAATVAHGERPLHLQANHAAAHALGLDARERVPADEIRIELHHPADAGFVRIGRGVHVIAIEQVARFRPQAFARRNTVLHDAKRPARQQQLIPDPRGEIACNHDFVAALAGVAGAADQARYLAVPGPDCGLREPIIAQRGQVRPRDPLQHLPRIRPLQRHQRGVGRDVLHLHVHALGMAQHPLVVLVDLGYVDDPDEVVGREAVADEIVDDVALGVAQRRIQGLVDRELGGVVGDQFLHQCQGVRPAELEFAHVRHIAQGNALARRLMLGDVAAVVHGAGHALEIDQRGRSAHVTPIQRRMFHALQSIAAKS